MRTRAWVLLLAAVWSLGCGGSLLEDARHEFDQGQYADAKRTILKIDASEYREQDYREQTEYALFRGLVMGALGDRTEAQAWLGAKPHEREKAATPAALPPDQTTVKRLRPLRRRALMTF